MKPSPSPRALACACLLSLCAPSVAAQGEDPSPRATLEARVDRAIRGAATWLLASAIRTDEEGMRWAADPRRPARRSKSLYAGTPGVVLFLALCASVETEAAFRDRLLAAARCGAREIDRDLRDPASKDAGLYTGIAGSAYVLLEVHRRCEGIEVDASIDAALARLESLATKTRNGLRWSTSNDVISGSAGIGLSLLQLREYYASRGDAPRRELCEGLASNCALELMRAAQTRDGTASWAMARGVKRRMPNFSHGTAGIAFFLARFASASWADEGARARARELAIAAGQGLIERADETNGGCRIAHHVPGGESLFYLGWCHGPVGTSRLFRILEAWSGSGAWHEWVRASTRSLLASGIPEQQQPGFWKNAGTCCGTAGVLDYALDLSPRDKDARATRQVFVQRLLEDLLASATHEGAEVSWISAEHRVRPKLRVAQTGFMQGAAGIAIRMLEWRQAQRGKPLGLVMPDDLGPAELRPAPAPVDPETRPRTILEPRRLPARR